MIQRVISIKLTSELAKNNFTDGFVNVCMSSTDQYPVFNSAWYPELNIKKLVNSSSIFVKKIVSMKQGISVIHVLYCFFNF